LKYRIETNNLQKDKTGGHTLVVLSCYGSTEQEDVSL